MVKKVFVLSCAAICLLSAADIACAQKVISVHHGARELQKAIDKAAGMSGDVVIELGEGTYRTDRTIEIGQGKWASLTIRAKAGESVSITGDKVVPASRIKPATDAEILSRIQPAMRGKVLQADCRGLVKALSGLHPSGFGRKSMPAWSELIVGGEPLSLSRWPNDSMTLIGKVDVSGGADDKAAGRLPIFHYMVDRPERWNDVSDMWIGGYFGHGYADDMIPVKEINTADSTIHAGMFTTYQFFSGADFRRWYAVNLVEEIDVPGEYVLDSVNGKFYFLPPAGYPGDVRLTVLETPVIALEGCSGVTICGLTIENSRGIGVYMDNTEGVVIDSCTLRNLGSVAVCVGKGTDSDEYETPLHAHSMEAGGELRGRLVGDVMGKLYENPVLDRQAGHNNGVRNCRIYNVGAGGVSLGGGNRQSLDRSCNFVENCMISRYNRIEKSYRPAVWIDGVGNRVSKCDIFDAPSMAILFHGNDHIIELCDITNVCSEVDDQGAIYYGRDPSERGNVIRYNYFHSLSPRHRVTATYHDDGACASEVYGNIYYKAGSMPVLIGGGMDHDYHDNIFIDSPLAIHIDNRLQNWASGMVAEGGIFDKRLKAVDYTAAPYSAAYPRLAGYWNENPALPKRNYIHGNLFYRIGNVLNGKTSWAEWWNNWITDSDPGFVDADNPLRGFRPDAPVFERISGFCVPPFAEIGCSLDNL